MEKKKELHRIEITPAENGHSVQIFHKDKDSMGLYGKANDKPMVFKNEEHGKMMDHIHSACCQNPDKCEAGNMKEDKKNLLKHGESTKHPGFVAVQNSISKKEGVSEKVAGAILAARSRSASPAAHKANPHLGRVK